MRMSRIASVACALMVGFLSACASGGSSAGATNTMAGEETADSAPMSVVIRNNAPGATTVTVYMMPEVGVDRPLGTVEAGREQRFPFDGQPGRYRIRLVGSAGDRISDIFQLFNNSEARWDVSLGNRVRVGARR
jgi:hypothetical protein